MTRGARGLSGLVLVGACCLAGCGAFGSSVVQGSKSDTPLEAGIGQQFQKLVPSGTAVQDVRCLRQPTPQLAGECKIRMIRGKPDPVYVYEVTTNGRHKFLAYSSTTNQGDAWRPPDSFSAGY